LLNNDTTAAFTPAGGGRVLFVRNDNLYCQQLDLKARKLLGGPELLQEHVASYAGSRNAYFSVSRTGTIAWSSGTSVVSQVMVFDRKGNRLGRAGTPAPINTITLAPDESRLIASGEAGSWIVEANGPGRVALKRRTDESDFRWMADGSHLISIRGKKVVERSVDSEQVRELAEIPIPKRNYAGFSGISPDGRHILVNSQTGLFLFALEGKGMQERMVAPPTDNSALSPDGRWVLYRLNAEPGIYVQSSSGTGLPRQIADTGSCPVWRADGREILFYDRPNTISSVRVEGSGDAPKFAAPQPLFSVTPPLGTDSASHPLAVNRDGSRIYFLQSSEQTDSGVIQVRVAAIQ
jgi:hypothetical protein